MVHHHFIGHHSARSALNSSATRRHVSRARARDEHDCRAPTGWPRRLAAAARPLDPPARRRTRGAPSRSDLDLPSFRQRFREQSSIRLAIGKGAIEGDYLSPNERGISTRGILECSFTRALPRNAMPSLVSFSFSWREDRLSLTWAMLCSKYCPIHNLFREITYVQSNTSVIFRKCTNYFSLLNLLYCTSLQ